MCVCVCHSPAVTGPLLSIYIIYFFVGILAAPGRLGTGAFGMLVAADKKEVVDCFGNNNPNPANITATSSSDVMWKMLNGWKLLQTNSAVVADDDEKKKKKKTPVDFCPRSRRQSFSGILFFSSSSVVALFSFLNDMYRAIPGAILLLLLLLNPLNAHFSFLLHLVCTKRWKFSFFSFPPGGPK